MPTELTPKDVVELIDKSIKTAEEALDLYNKVVDQLVPWKTFEETITNIERYKDDYSKEAAELVGKTKTLLLDSQDKYYMSTQSIYRWCGLTIKIIPIFIKTLDTSDQSDFQHKLIMKVLDDGIEKINDAIKLLGESSASFNLTSGNLTALDSRLKHDFDNKSSYFKSRVDQIRKEAYGGAASGLIAGPFGLVISYSIAVGVVEGKLIPELNKKLTETKEFFIKLRTDVANAGKEIGNIKDKLKDEVKELGNLGAEVDSAKTIFDLCTPEFRALITESADSLLKACDEYQIRHGRDKGSKVNKVELSFGDWSERKTPQLGSPIFKIFEQSVGKLIGVNYTLIAYYEQIVNGTNYCLEVEGTVVAPDAKPKTTWAYLHVSSTGEISSLEFKDHPPK